MRPCNCPLVRRLEREQRGSQEAVKHRGAVAAACAARGQGPAQGGWHHAGGQAYAGAEGGREAYIHNMEEGMRARGRQCREASWAGHGSGGVVGRRSRLLTARWPRRRPSRCQAGRRSTAGRWAGGGWDAWVGRVRGRAELRASGQPASPSPPPPTTPNPQARTVTMLQLRAQPTRAVPFHTICRGVGGERGGWGRVSVGGPLADARAWALERRPHAPPHRPSPLTTRPPACSARPGWPPRSSTWPPPWRRWSGRCPC